MILHEAKFQKSSENIEIKNTNSTDLWITIDYSNLFYMPALKLFKRDSKFVSVNNKMPEIKPSEVFTDI